jgi:glutathione S-transferase
MFYEKSTTPLTSQGKADADKLIQVAEAVISETSENLFGQWTLVDSELAFMLHRLILNNHEVPAKVFKYANAQWKRASVQEWVNHVRKPYIPY